jgi:hypothetical protein
LRLIALRSVSLLHAFVCISATPDSVYLRAFRQLLFLDRARRATDKDHGDPRRGSSRTAKTVRGSGGPWAGGSHLFYTSIPGLTIVLISLITPFMLRELNPPQTSGYQPYRSASSTPSTRPSLCVAYAEYVIFTSTRWRRSLIHPW